MAETKKLVTDSYQGEHLRWSSAFWDQTILPFLAD